MIARLRELLMQEGLRSEGFWFDRQEVWALLRAVEAGKVMRDHIEVEAWQAAKEWDAAMKELGE